MREIRVEFQIDGKDYLLFIEKQLWSRKFYLFQKKEGRLDKSVKIEKVSTSTAKDVLEHWWILLGLKLRKKLKKKGSKARGCYIGKRSRRNIN